MRRSDLRKVTDRINGGRYYFHQWYNDFEENGDGFVAVVEGETGEITLMNYGCIKFLPDGMTWKNFESKKANQKSFDETLSSLKAPPMPPVRNPKGLPDSDNGDPSFDFDDDNQITSGFGFSRKK